MTLTTPNLLLSRRAERIADLFEEYANVGVSIFQIYGYPFLEQALHVGERVLPVVKARLAKI